MKILVVGDPGSIHANRFLNLLRDLGHDVRMFQSARYYVQEEHLRDTVVYVAEVTQPPINGNSLVPEPGAANRLWRSLRRLSPALGRAASRRDAHRAKESRAPHLIQVIQAWAPEIVFSLKMQNDGYTVAEARERMADAFRAKWVHFCWGTDIEFFGRHPEYAPSHLPRIRRVLALCDFLLADTKRDLRAARELGFAGEILGDCIAPGGFDLEELSSSRRHSVGSRDTILVKGREGGFVGRALNVFEALDRVAPRIAPYCVRVMMATPPVEEAARALAVKHRLDCAVVPRLAYPELLRLFGRSRIAIAASDVDGTPSFLIEAMVMGALPIHSDMESVREWVEHGLNGLLFPVSDVDALASCISVALDDDALIASAAALNWEIAEQRMSRPAIRERIRTLIDTRIHAGADQAHEQDRRGTAAHRD